MTGIPLITGCGFDSPLMTLVSWTREIDIIRWSEGVVLFFLFTHSEIEL